jgi:hypothetical protein
MRRLGVGVLCGAALLAGCGGDSISAQQATEGVRAEYGKLKPNLEIAALTCVKAEDAERTFECRGSVAKPGQDGARVELEIEALADEGGDAFVLEDRTDYAALEGSTAERGSAPVDRENEYLDGVNEAQDEFARSVDDLAGRITETSSTAEDRAAVAQFESEIDDLGAGLRAIDPPEEVMARHQRLLEVIARYGETVGQAVQALDTEDEPDALLAAQTRLLDATEGTTTEIRETIEEINRELN